MSAGQGLPLSDLIGLCRSLRHYLGAGLLLPQALRQQGQRASASVRAVAERMAGRLEQGSGLHQVMRQEGGAFPPLMLSLVQVGERTGMLPEVFAELEKYYTRSQKLRQQFWSRAAWPLFQFVMAIVVLTGLIAVLGTFPVNQRPGAPGYDPLGLGLAGTGGALIFLACVAGLLLALLGGWWLIRRSLGGRARVDAFLLRQPALGPCLQALALQRFCLALRLTHETGMSIVEAIKLSLRATGNRAFEAQTDVATTLLREGEEVTTALTRTGLFPEDFLHILAVAEESGRLDEVLRHQADHYHEEAERRLTVLTALAGYGVWIAVGAVLIIAIFRLALSYFSMFDQIR
jgi:type IV pilus assembly protein PilC